MTENTGLTLTHYTRQSGLELVFGLLHLLLVLALLARQPADVAVGGLDHGVEVVGVPAVDFASFKPGQEHAHRFGKLAVVWPRGANTEKRNSRKSKDKLFMHSPATLMLARPKKITKPCKSEHDYHNPCETRL